MDVFEVKSQVVSLSVGKFNTSCKGKRSFGGAASIRLELVA